MRLLSIFKRTYEAGLGLVGFPQGGRVEAVRRCEFGHSVYAATKRCSYGHRIARKSEPG